MHPPCKANPSEASSRLTYAARGERKVSALNKRKWLLSEVGWQTSSIKPPPPPSQTGLHHLSQCCLGSLDQGLSYPVQLSYTVPPFKILERYWLEGRLRRPSSSDLGEAPFIKSGQITAGDGHQKHKTHSDWSQALASEHPSLPDCLTGSIGKFTCAWIHCWQ